MKDPVAITQPRENVHFAIQSELHERNVSFFYSLTRVLIRLFQRSVLQGLFIFTLITVMLLIQTRTTNASASDNLFSAAILTMLVLLLFKVPQLIVAISVLLSAELRLWDSKDGTLFALSRNFHLHTARKGPMVRGNASIEQVIRQSSDSLSIVTGRVRNSKSTLQSLYEPFLFRSTKGDSVNLKVTAQIRTTAPRIADRLLTLQMQQRL